MADPATLADLPRESIDRARQSERQKPLVVLLAMSDIRGARAQALHRYAALDGREVTTYEPNTAFAMSGSALDLPGSPLGPYAIAGLRVPRREALRRQARPGPRGVTA